MPSIKFEVAMAGDGALGWRVTSQLQHRDVWSWTVLSRGRLFCVAGGSVAVSPSS